ncbi:glutamine synthetase-like [Haliotis rufescens]|uniref:glutamine synthetase-like n=1 Tax=Haliotis rufescens TaxID=6454 RepID=UPI001EB04D87|nr:glutamine synthetase-like [Haliotis rufescens]
MSKFEEVQKEICKYDYVRFALCDLNGMNRGQVIAGRYAAEYMDDGLDLCEDTLVFGPRTEITTIVHEKNYNIGNMLIFPDADTLRSIPWAPDGVKVAEVLCESRWKKDNSPQDACPRYVARQQLQRLGDLGFDLYSGHEIEFILLDNDTLKPVFAGDDMYSNRVFNNHSKLLFHFDRHFQESKIDVERYHVEMGPGLFEAVAKPKYGIESPDMAFSLREGLLEMADLEGFKITFMSHPYYNQMGLSTHLNFSLWNRSGENIFYDECSPDKLSTVAKRWIAGILKHSKALCAFANPTVNCYRNLGKFGYPSTICWGIEDRYACIRAKNDGPSRTYLENRLPGGKSNLYLVLASTIAAGLDGVIKKMECPPPGKTKDDESLPLSLAEALDELEKDEVLCNALGKELVTWFVKCKRDVEVAKFKLLKSDEERFAMERVEYL